MAPTLYTLPASPPVRAVLITAKAIGLELNLAPVDLLQGEHKKPEYVKINPQQTIPTLVDDDGFTVWDSHAIITYLVSKYAKNDSLYPQDLKKRALIDQRLHFDSGVLFPKMAAITRPAFFGNKTSIDQADKDSINEAYAFLEAFLAGKDWLANNSLSIADYAVVATVSSLNVLIPIDGSKFPSLTSWFKRVQGVPEYAANEEGLAGFIAFAQLKLKL